LLVSLADMGAQGVERSLRRFIVEELLDEGYDGRDPLATDAIDSLGVEQLVDYIGETFGVRLVDDEITRENFASVPVLAAFVESKLAGVR
jgi:acyl carrier protein